LHFSHPQKAHFQQVNLHSGNPIPKPGARAPRIRKRTVIAVTGVHLWRIPTFRFIDTGHCCILFNDRMESYPRS
jgi:hypothetical protein